jgi:hypothetical protein
MLRTKFTHHNQKVIQKRITVDKKIAPLIRWMNNLNGVITQFSCEGAKVLKENNWVNSKIPYVTFNCFCPTSLYYIFTHVALYTCEIKVENYPLNYGPIRYSFYFKSPEKLKECISNLPKIKMEIYEI